MSFKDRYYDVEYESQLLGNDNPDLLHTYKNGTQRLAVWLVRDCGLFTYQVTAKFGAGYYAPKTTETLINYTACWHFVLYFNVVIYLSPFKVTEYVSFVCFSFSRNP